MDIDKQTIKVLASDTRLDILRALTQRRKMPSELSRQLGMATSTITDHLKKLEAVELVERKETGHKWIYYELTRKGRDVVKPRVPVQFVLMLSIGILFVFSGVLSVSYTYDHAFSYPIVYITETLTKTIPQVGEATSIRGLSSGSDLSGSDIAIPEENTIVEISNTTDYEDGTVEVEGINWIAVGLIAVGGSLLLFAGYEIYRQRSIAQTL